MKQQENANQAQRQPREWLAIRCFRGLIKLYINSSYRVSKTVPQILLTLCAIFSNLYLIFLLVSMCHDGIIRLSLAMVLGVASAALQAVSQTVGMYTYFVHSQPRWRLITIFTISGGFMLVSIFALFRELLSIGYRAPAWALVYTLLFNVVMFYYIFWEFLGLFVLMLMAGEAIVRTLTFSLSKPYNTNIKLPFFFYPRAPGIRFKETEAPPRWYTPRFNSGVEECILCLEPFQSGEQISILACHESHLFHYDCLRQWKIKSDTCPMCREPIRDARFSKPKTG